MENVRIIRIVDVTEITESEDKFILHDLQDGKYYFGNGNSAPTEITTDNSNKWAKIFFYGSD